MFTQDREKRKGITTDSHQPWSGLGYASQNSAPAYLHTAAADFAPLPPPVHDGGVINIDSDSDEDPAVDALASTQQSGLVTGAWPPLGRAAQVKSLPTGAMLSCV